MSIYRLSKCNDVIKRRNHVPVRIHNVQQFRIDSASVNSPTAQSISGHASGCNKVRHNRPILRYGRHIRTGVSIVGVAKAAAVPAPNFCRRRNILGVHYDDLCQFVVGVIDEPHIAAFRAGDLRRGVFHRGTDLGAGKVLYIPQHVHLTACKRNRSKALVILGCFADASNGRRAVYAKIDICKRTHVPCSKLIRKCNPVHRPQVWRADNGCAERRVREIVYFCINRLKHCICIFSVNQVIIGQIQRVCVCTCQINRIVIALRIRKFYASNDNGVFI